MSMFSKKLILFVQALVVFGCTVEAAQLESLPKSVKQGRSNDISSSWWSFVCDRANELMRRDLKLGHFEVRDVIQETNIKNKFWKLYALVNEQRKEDSQVYGYTRETPVVGGKVHVLVEKEKDRIPPPEYEDVVTLVQRFDEWFKKKEAWLDGINREHIQEFRTLIDDENNKIDILLNAGKQVVAKCNGVEIYKSDERVQDHNDDLFRWVQYHYREILIQFLIKRFPDRTERYGTCDLAWLDIFPRIRCVVDQRKRDFINRVVADKLGRSDLALRIESFEDTDFAVFSKFSWKDGAWARCMRCSLWSVFGITTMSSFIVCANKVMQCFDITGVANLDDIYFQVSPDSYGHADVGTPCNPKTIRFKISHKFSLDFCCGMLSEWGGFCWLILWFGIRRSIQQCRFGQDDMIQKRECCYDLCLHESDKSFIEMGVACVLSLMCLDVTDWIVIHCLCCWKRESSDILYEWIGHGQNYQGEHEFFTCENQMEWDIMYCDGGLMLVGSACLGCRSAKRRWWR